MNTLTDAPRTSAVRNGEIVITFESGANLSFPFKDNPRLAAATDKQLRNMELSPFGIHWPDLDEDLSFKGIQSGDFGQRGTRD